jgi:hypothetical protein
MIIIIIFWEGGKVVDVLAIFQLHHEVVYSYKAYP